MSNIFAGTPEACSLLLLCVLHSSVLDQLKTHGGRNCVVFLLFLLLLLKYYHNFMIKNVPFLLSTKTEIN